MKKDNDEILIFLIGAFFFWALTFGFMISIIMIIIDAA